MKRENPRILIELHEGSRNYRFVAGAAGLVPRFFTISREAKESGGPVEGIFAVVHSLWEG